jgi:hypothetical protein
MTRRKPLFGTDGEAWSYIARGETRTLYIQRLPDPEEIAPDELIVHNHVRPHRIIGQNGFRAWLQRMADWIEPCDCGWAKRPHYRVKQ